MDADRLAVVGAALIVELVGWTGAVPRLPGELALDEARREDGRRRVVYDLLPQRRAMSLSLACERIGMLVAAALDDWPLRGAPLPAALRLEMGLAADTGEGPCEFSFPPAFLSALGEAEIGLALTLYRLASDGDAGQRLGLSTNRSRASIDS